ncbi:MAG: hypothetical protein L0212_10745, partial [Acidobacteria bacterium]|nr:hypothetical protein [Acidobacteriota bacterium]
FLVCAAGVRAQEHQHQPEAGDAQKLGRVVFPTSCTTEAQADFNRAVAMLHSFWYQAAEKAFVGVAEKDPDCALAYWGVAMSRFHPIWEKLSPEDAATGQAALVKARAAARTDRERDYIRALAQFYTDADKAEHLSRLALYENAMAKVRERNADDPEAAIFYSLSLLGTAYSSPPDKTYARQKKAGAILEKIFAEQPEHPGVAHYIIHSYDYPPLAERALTAARAYAKIAPAAPHALHMPSHIFTRRGYWEESISSNRAAAAAAHKDNWIGEELHAMDYLTYAYLQGAQDGEAKTILSARPELQKGELSYFAGLYATAAMPARYAVERREWVEAATLKTPEGVFPGGAACWAEANLDFARGLAWARLGAITRTRESMQALQECEQSLLQVNDKLWGAQVEVQRQTVAAWLALLLEENEEAVRLMRAAADLEDSADKHPVTPGAVVPARELLGEMLLELKYPAEAALREFETALLASPNRFRSLYGAARAAELAGETGKARQHFERLVELCGQADTERAELREARSFLAQKRAYDSSRK